MKALEYAPSQDRKGQTLRPGDHVSFKVNYQRTHSTARGLVVVSPRTLVVLADGSTAPALAIESNGTVYGMPSPKGVLKLSGI